ncbi:MAG: hypothetical protein LBJ41_03025 [Treponema sp.]|jgi:hypothetical protein|nr:hypothetical protein [Treponema sp.]
MKMKLNWITMSLWSALFVFALMSCDMQMPESVRVKSQPGLYISLGNPFEGTDMSLNTYLDTDGLKTQLNKDSGGGTPGIELIDNWENPDDPTLQTYLVRYPVADININLSEYVEKMELASNVSDASGVWIPGTGSEIEIPLPLTDMSFAKDVTKVTITVALTFIPGFTPPTDNATGGDTVPAGTTVTFSGAVFTSGSQPELSGNKWNSATIEKFQPADDKISIGVTVPAGYWFKPQLEFDWEEAKITLGEDDGKQEGEYVLDFSGFSDSMGKGVSFKSVTGYMYLQKPGNDFTADATVKLKWEASGPQEKTITPIEKALPTLKDFDPSNTEYVPNDTNKDKYPIDLTKVFEYPHTLAYELTLTAAPIKKTDNKVGQLKADIVILLPLEFTLADSDESDNFSGYKKLNIDALKDQGSNDLLGRTDGGNEDDIFKNLKSVSIMVDNYNTIIDGLYLGVKNKNDSTEPLNLGSQGGTIKLTNLDYPFAPQFELLVEDNKTLKILKPAPGKDTTIEITIAVQAVTDMDYQIKF